MLDLMLYYIVYLTLSFRIVTERRADGREYRIDKIVLYRNLFSFSFGSGEGIY